MYEQQAKQGTDFSAAMMRIDAVIANLGDAAHRDIAKRAAHARRSLGQRVRRSIEQMEANHGR